MEQSAGRMSYHGCTEQPIVSGMSRKPGGVTVMRRPETLPLRVWRGAIIALSVGLVLLSILSFGAQASAAPPFRDGRCQKDEGVTVFIDVTELEDSWPEAVIEYGEEHDEPGYLVRCITDMSALESALPGSGASGYWLAAMTIAGMEPRQTEGSTDWWLLGVENHDQKTKWWSSTAGSGGDFSWCPGDGSDVSCDPVRSLEKNTFFAAKFATRSSLSLSVPGPYPLPGLTADFDPSPGGSPTDGDPTDGPEEGGPGNGPGEDSAIDSPGDSQASGDQSGNDELASAPAQKEQTAVPQMPPEPASTASAPESPTPESSRAEDSTPSTEASSVPPEIWGDDATAALVAATAVTQIWPWVLVGAGAFSLAGLGWVWAAHRRPVEIDSETFELAAHLGRESHPRNLPEDEESW